MIPYKQGLPGWKDITRLFYRICVLGGDLTSVSIGYTLAYFFRFYSDSFMLFFPVTKGFPPFIDYLKASPVIFFMWIIAIGWIGGYRRINYPAIDEALRMFRASVLGTILAMSAMFLYRESEFSRLVFLLGGVCSGCLIYTLRQIIKILYVIWIRRTRKPLRVLIVGNGYLSVSMRRVLERQGDRAILSLHHFEIGELKKSIVRSRISEVLVANPNVDHKKSPCAGKFL